MGTGRPAFYSSGVAIARMVLYRLIKYRCQTGATTFKAYCCQSSSSVCGSISNSLAVGQSADKLPSSPRYKVAGVNRSPVACSGDAVGT